MEFRLILAALLMVSITATWSEIHEIHHYQDVANRLRYIESFERSHRLTFIVDPNDWNYQIPIEKDFHPTPKDTVTYNLYWRIQ